MDGVKAAIELAEPAAVLLLGLVDLALEPFGSRLGLRADHEQAVKRRRERSEERERVESRAQRGGCRACNQPLRERVEQVRSGE